MEVAIVTNVTNVGSAARRACLRVLSKRSNRPMNSVDAAGCTPDTICLASSATPKT